MKRFEGSQHKKRRRANYRFSNVNSSVDCNVYKSKIFGVLEVIFCLETCTNGALNNVLSANFTQYTWINKNSYARLNISVLQMTIILWRRFTVGRLTQTPIKYIFSESLIIVDYESILIYIKKLRFSEHSALFLKVPRFTNQVRFRSDLSGRTRSTSLFLLVFLTPFSKGRTIRKVMGEG